jgi:hypothetical protein
MISSRYALSVLGPGLLAGLLACTPATSVGSAESSANLPATEQLAQSDKSADAAQTDPAKRVESANSSEPQVAKSLSPVASADPLPVGPPKAPASAIASNSLDRCYNMVAYDPADTSVNMRDRPDGNVIHALPNGSVLQQEGPAGYEPGWNRVYALDTGAWGYVWGDLMYRALYTVQDPDENTAYMRSTPNGEIINELQNGTLVRFLGVEGDWMRVETEDGISGYVAQSRLTGPGNCL